MNPSLQNSDQHTAPAEVPENKEVIQMGIEDIVDRIRKAAYWFFGIAALSIINSILLSKGVYFIMGLAISQVIDGIVLAATGEYNFVFGALSPVLFIVLGIFGAKLQRWAFITGTLIYLIDAVIYLYVGEWLAFAFHGFVIYKLFKGYQAIKEYEELSAKVTSVEGVLDSGI